MKPRSIKTKKNIESIYTVLVYPEIGADTSYSAARGWGGKGRMSTAGNSQNVISLIKKYNTISGDKHFKNMHFMNLTFRMLVTIHFQKYK